MRSPKPPTATNAAREQPTGSAAPPSAGIPPTESHALHQPSGRWLFGLGLALTTAGFWGMLPIGLKIVLEQIDPLTTTWYRFAASALLLFTYMRARGTIPDFRSLESRHWKLLAVATVALSGNYVGYVMGLERTNASTAQVLIQIAPVLLTMGGIVIFKERFSTMQWVGVGTLLAGLMLFSYDRITGVTGDSSRFALGVAIMLGAGVSWAVYGLAQKQLLTRLSSQAIMLSLYIGATILFTPLATPSAVLNLNTVGWLALAFSIANMLIAYAAFSEALAHWEATRVSAVLACVPLLTLAAVTVATAIIPEIVKPEVLTTVSLWGAGLVVLGSLATALGRS
jgi:drug/metabolite transporter (DMT)-like permease